MHKFKKIFLNDTIIINREIILFALFMVFCVPQTTEKIWFPGTYKFVAYCLIPQLQKCLTLYLPAGNSDKGKDHIEGKALHTCLIHVSCFCYGSSCLLLCTMYAVAIHLPYTRSTVEILYPYTFHTVVILSSYSPHTYLILSAYITHTYLVLYVP